MCGLSCQLGRRLVRVLGPLWCLYRLIPSRLPVLHRVQLQHNQRVVYGNSVPFSDTFRMVIDDVFKLATNHYSYVSETARLGDRVGVTVGGSRS